MIMLLKTMELRSKDYFIEDLGSSSEDDNTAHWTRDRSGQNDTPPALLAFSITLGRGEHGGQSQSPSFSEENDGERESSDSSVEEWMILDLEPEEGDSSIQLNLSYSNISSEEDTDCKDDENASFQDSWAVSKRDKESSEVLSICRYFMPGQLSICPICKKTGHLAKSCQAQRKCAVCVLCGIQGHFQKECPRRPCSRCGLLAHGARACDRPPVWHQHCQRCGITGHLSDACPDTWRQFHHTIKMCESPIKRRMHQTIKRKKRPAHCYNCSKRGHFGYECRIKRMISGTFFTLPYVCQYDTSENAHHTGSRTENKSIEITNKTQPLAEQQHCLTSFGEDKDELFQRRNKMKQKAQVGVRKTWPERRRERQEVKRLRREAQARREGGVLGQCQHKPDDDILYFDPSGANNQWQHKNPSKRKTDVVNRSSRKSRDTERWKKRGQKKLGLLCLYKEMDVGTENRHSPKERVRHRRR